MNEVTLILAAIDNGDSQAAEKLLPIVYEELRKLAAQRLSHERPGQTLQATALVHEAYLRLVDREKVQHWDSRRHFFAAAAESMRRILIEAARRKHRLRHGGDAIRINLDQLEIASPDDPEFLLILNDALDGLAAVAPQASELVKLRFFAGCTNEEAASLLAVSPRKANQIWAYARAWLLESLADTSQ